MIDLHCSTPDFLDPTQLIGRPGCLSEPNVGAGRPSEPNGGAGRPGEPKGSTLHLSVAPKQKPSVRPSASGRQSIDDGIVYSIESVIDLVWRATYSPMPCCAPPVATLLF